MRNKRVAIIVSVLVIVGVAAISFLIISAIQYYQEKDQEVQIEGSYAFAELIYMNPISSFFANEDTMRPFVFVIDSDSLKIANTEWGTIQHNKKNGGTRAFTGEEFMAAVENPAFGSDNLDVSGFKRIWRHGLFVEAGQKNYTYAVFLLDDKVWLVRYLDEAIFSVYRLEPCTDDVEGIVSLPVETITAADTVFGGFFSITPDHLHVFTINGEGFEPRDTFMYLGADDVFVNKSNLFFDFAELIDYFSSAGLSDVTECLEKACGGDLSFEIIAGRQYIRASDLEPCAVDVTVDWELSSRTPVSFTTR